MSDNLKSQFTQSFPNSSQRMCSEIFDAAAAAAARPFPMMTDTRDLEILCFVGTVADDGDQIIVTQPSTDARMVEITIREEGVSSATFPLTPDDIDQLLQILSRARACITK